MTPPRLDFGLLKQRVTIEQVLARRGLLEPLTRRGHRLVGACPVHGGDNPTAFVVDCRRNLWRCFTCDDGGDVVEIVRRLHVCGYREAAHVLAAIAGDDEPFLERLSPPPRTRARPFRPYRTRLTLDPNHPFLAARRIRTDTARRHDVGAWHGRGMLAGCVAVRLHDAQGAPIGYAGRRLQPRGRGKWVFPSHLPKSELLYGLHRVQSTRRMVVVEGPWDVLRLHQLDIPSVALLGTSLSATQVELLRPWPAIVVLLDGDATGRRAATQVATRLRARRVNLPDGRDPADLEDRELRSLLLF